MRSSLKKLAALVGVMTLLAISGPALSAQSTADFTPNPIPVSPGETQVSVNATWNFGATNSAVFLDICRRLSSDPQFNLTDDCDRAGSKASNGSANGQGSRSMTVPVGPTFGWQVFGQSIDKWGCFPDDPGFPVPDGFGNPETCYLRITQNVRSNNDDAVDIPIEWAVGGTEIPEAPLVVLPVLIGAVGVGGFLYMSRRRSIAA